MNTIKLFRSLTMLMLSSIIVLTSLESCSDDPFDGNTIQTVELTQGESKDLSNIEQYSYVIPFEVKAEGEWKISFSFNEGHQICYALPAEGKGPAQVKICVLDNWTDENRTGDMKVVDLQNPSASRSYKLSQKCNLDYGTRAGNLVTPNKGNIIYGVGYGYNIYKPVSSALSLSPIVRVEEFKSNGVIHTEGTETLNEYVQYTGSYFDELLSDYKIKAKVDSKVCGLEAELSAAFGMKDFKSNDTEYILSEVNVVKNNVVITNANHSTISEYLMCEEAYANINGIPYVNEGASLDREPIVAYPNTKEGFYNLVKTYGTHLIVRAKTGGRLRFATTVNVSNVEGNYDLSSYAKCNYAPSFANASAGLSQELKESYRKNKQELKTNISVYGGNEFYANALSDGKESSYDYGTQIMGIWYGQDYYEDYYESWYKSLDDVTNQKMIGVDMETLIPLWELVSEAEAGGRVRKSMLKDYIENQLPLDMAEEQGTQNYESGTVTHISNIPDFAAEKLDDTLIKDVYSDGHHMARICNEFIPQIDKTDRITVIYPVINGKVKYNLGYWPGDDSHKPYRICCTDDDIKVREVSDGKKGKKNEVFLRGSSFYTLDCKSELMSRAAIVESDIKKTYLEAPSSTYDAKPFQGKYQLVKIFNRIWQRTQYCEVINNSDGQNNYTNRLHYYPRDIEKFTVSNWRVATVDDWKNLSNGLTQKAGFNLPASKMFTDSNYNATDISGFMIYWGGWKAYGKHRNGNGNDQMEYMTRNGNSFGHVRILKTGSLEICENDYNQNNWRMCVRLVQSLSGK